MGGEAAGPGVAGTAAAAKRILAEVERAVVGKRHVLELVLAGLLADGHVLLDDLPGVAKTLLARSFATVAGLEFRRLQLTPDVLPADITGTMVLDLATTTPVFRPGPVFAQLVLADEINRAPAKTQAALLEAMQERQVTMDGNTHPLPRPFLTIATQNPIESEGTYPLPEAQLDRFLLRTGVGYPTPDDELELLAQRLTRGQDDVVLTPVVTAEEFRAMQASLEQVHVDRSIAQYAVALVTATRSDKQLEVGSSPRGSLALIKLARAIAVLAGRDFTTPDDMRAIAVPALAHRVVLRSEAWARRVSSDDVVRQIVDRVPAPNWR
ncbi:AAA family ATPase [Actinocatenispora comari]|uniref:AAA family ATPase n=1 Tax=Actinocatenispora comari TaxID=2807577 RepID=UPI001A928985